MNVKRIKKGGVNVPMKLVRENLWIYPRTPVAVFRSGDILILRNASGNGLRGERDVIFASSEGRVSLSPTLLNSFGAEHREYEMEGVGDMIIIRGKE